MNKRPLMGGAVLMAGGIWAASVRAWYAYGIAAALFLLVFFSFASGSFRRSAGSLKRSLFPLPRAAFLILFFYILSFFTGFLLFLSADSASRWYEALDLDDAAVTVTGTVCNLEEEAGMQSVYLKNVILVYDGRSYAANRILIRTYYDTQEEAMPSYDSLRIGNRIRAAGTVSYFSESRNPGNFNAREYYRIRGIDFRITPQTVTVEEASVRVIPDFLNRIKKRLSVVFESCLTEDAYGVLNTMVLGDDAALSEETETLYQEAGISHILAISGLHVSIVGMLLYRLMRKKGLSYFACAVPCAAAVLSYALMSGAAIAVQRAVIMFCVMLAGNCLGLAYDSLSALSLAAMVILASNPLYLFSASFQLSFSAVLGVSAVFPMLASFLKIRHAAAQTVLLSFAVQLVTIPVTLYYYFEIPVFSLLSNAVMVPFVSVLLADGIAGGLIGLFYLPAARIVLLPAAWILKGYARLCGLIRKIPGHMLIAGRPALARIVLYYAVLSAALVLIGIARRRGVCGRSAVKNMLSVGLVSAVLICVMAVRIPVSFRITMIDVGQGDGILAESGGINVMIDGGSSDITDVGTWRILPYLKYLGIGSVDIWMVTHTDSDHTSGLVNLLESGYRIRYLAFAEGVYADEDLEELVLLAAQNGTQVLFLEQGGTISQGDACWTVIYPENDNSYTDKNEASMVLLLKYGDFTALFTGDISADTEADLIEACALTKYLSRQDRISGIDLLKTAHHGSRYSSSQEFLELVSPSAAIISAGVDNLYGHPSEETLIRLREYTQEIYVTAQTGAITLTLKDGQMIFRTFLNA